MYKPLSPTGPAFLLSSALVQLIAACPWLGPSLPPPSGQYLMQAWNDVEHKITSELSALLDPNTTSLSLQIVTASEQAPLFEFYHKATEHVFVGTDAGDELDGETVLRIGSVTKMFTVYALLLKCGFHCFDDPITKHVPELLQENASGANWEDITVGALASQMSGIGRDYANYDVAAIYPSSYIADLGLPAVDDAAVDPPLTTAAHVPPCGYNWTDSDGCTWDEALPLIQRMHTIFEPFYSPEYSNPNYQLLGRVLESLYDHTASYEEIMRDLVYTPLNLTRTWTYAPTDADVGTGLRAPGEAGLRSWNNSLGDEVPSGGSYMSNNDLARHLRAVMNHAQLSPVQTRRWLKPASFLGHMEGAIGMPWEIVRVDRGIKGVVDVYRKDGATPQYGESVYGLLDGWGVGYSAIVLYGDQTTLPIADVEEVIVAHLAAALEAAAHEQTQKVVTGRYADENENEIVLAVDEDGLYIDAWRNNGVDFLASYQRIMGATTPTEKRFSIYPAQLEGGDDGDASLRAVYRLSPESSSEAWYGCHSWVGLDLWRYASQPLDELVLVKDKLDGKVETVEWLGGRVRLTRAS